MGRKSLLGNIPLNIARNRGKGTKSYKVVECSDVNATMEIAINLIGNVQYSEAPSSTVNQQMEMCLSVGNRLRRKREEMSEEAFPSKKGIEVSKVYSNRELSIDKVLSNSTRPFNMMIHQLPKASGKR